MCFFDLLCSSCCQESVLDVGLISLLFVEASLTSFANKKLLVAPGMATRNPGIATSGKGATSSHVRPKRLEFGSNQLRLFRRMGKKKQRPESSEEQRCRFCFYVFPVGRGGVEVFLGLPRPDAPRRSATEIGVFGIGSWDGALSPNWIPKRVMKMT